jgi:hypothetical protein
MPAARPAIISGGSTGLASLCNQLHRAIAVFGESRLMGATKSCIENAAPFLSGVFFNLRDMSQLLSLDSILIP